VNPSKRKDRICHICDVVTFWGICFLPFALFFHEEERIIYYTAQILPLLSWFAKIIFLSTRRQWKRTLLQYLLMVSALFLVTLLFGRQSPARLMGTFFWELGILSFFVLFIINREFPFRPSVSRWKLKRAFDVALGIYGFVVLLSCFISYFPEESFPQLRKGFVAYLLIYLCISDNVRTFEKFRKLVLVLYLFVILSSILVLLQGIAFPMGSYNVKYFLVKKEAVRLFDPATLNPLFHVQFPFNHFQKTALFLAIGLQLVMLQYFITVKRVSRRWVAVTGLIAVGGLLFTLSRTGFFTALAASVLLILLTKKKYLITLGAILLILAVFMPGLMRRHFLETFQPATFSNPSSDVSFYMERWALTGEAIRSRPVFGTGYGWKQFPEICRLVRPGAPFEKKPHPYSWYLQIALESGMAGLWGYLLFSAFLLGLLYQRWRQHPPFSYYRGINAALIALLVTPYLFGLTYFTARGGLVLLIWIVYGLCASYLKLTIKPKDIDMMRRELEGEGESLEDL